MKKLFLFLAMFLIYPAIAFANGNNGQHMGDWRHMMDFRYGALLMWIIFLILIGLVIYLVVQGARSKTSESSFRETPMDILKKRYAKGEITKEEFEKMKKDLES